MLATKKDKVDSYEKRLEINRSHMKREAKRATKQEKNLKVTKRFSEKQKCLIIFIFQIKTGGYRSRANELLKSYDNLINEVELAQRDLNVFQ